MKRRGKTLYMETSTPDGLFGTSYDHEVGKQKPNYDAPPYDRWPNGESYSPFVDAGINYDPEDLPFHVNEMQQIRTSYNPDKIADLAERVKSSEYKEPYIELEQAIRIAEFTSPEALRQFLDDFQLFHGLAEPIDFDIFDPEPNGNIRILNYGHRRTRAIKVASKQFNYTVLNKDVKKECMINPTFERFIDAQSRENEHDRPDPEDEALEIRKRFNFYTVKNDGAAPTRAWLARKMGLSTDKVRDALRFTDLSPSIMEWFDHGIINYAVAVECWRLREAAMHYYPQKYPQKYEVGSGKLAEDAEALVLAELTNFAKDHMQGASYERKLKVIQAKINSLDISKQEVALFDDSMWDDPQAQKAVGGKKMAKYAITVLEHRLNDAEVTDDELLALETLYDSVLRKRAEREQQQAVLLAEAKALAESVAYQESQALFG